MYSSIIRVPKTMNRSILTCLAVDEPADVVIGKTLRDTAREHAFQLEAQTVVLYKLFEKDSPYHI